MSPIQDARPGSTHGYDVVDPLTVNPELGGCEGLQALLEELSSLGLGLLIHIVPNHMAFDGGNHMLGDVLENGPDSRFFRFFDVDWDRPYESMKGRLLAPFLGDFYGTCPRGPHERFTGRAGDPASFDLLDGLLAEQLCRLSFWKVGTEELNYRRFFSINELISLRTEEQEVFNHAHALILELVGGRKGTGLRIDHVHGLYDPCQYLQRLRDRLPDCFVVVEKDPGAAGAAATGLAGAGHHRVRLPEHRERPVLQQPQRPEPTWRTPTIVDPWTTPLGRHCCGESREPSPPASLG